MSLPLRVFMNSQSDLLKMILEQFKVSKTGVHGPSHWARVKHHGMVIGAKVGANRLHNPCINGYSHTD